jgi:hypothetical protein
MRVRGCSETVSVSYLGNRSCAGVSRADQPLGHRVVAGHPRVEVVFVVATQERARCLQNHAADPCVRSQSVDLSLGRAQPHRGQGDLVGVERPIGVFLRQHLERPMRPLE